MKTVALSAGHGGRLFDPGATNDELIEAYVTMYIRDYVFTFLRKHSVGVLSVPDDLNLFESIKWINTRPNNIDIAIEIHINAGGGQGPEGWYYNGSEASANLARHIVNAIVAEVVDWKLYNRGVKDEATNRYGKLGFVHDTNPLAALIECGFIDHPKDYKILTSNEKLRNIAKGVTRGCLSYLGLPWQPNLLEDETPQKNSPETSGDEGTGEDSGSAPEPQVPVPDEPSDPPSDNGSNDDGNNGTPNIPIPDSPTGNIPPVDNGEDKTLDIVQKIRELLCKLICKKK